MLRGLILIVFGAILGVGLLVGGSLYLEAQGAPTPASLCNDRLDGDGWRPTSVDIDRANNSVLVTCERGDQTELVSAELNVMDDIRESHPNETSDRMGVVDADDVNQTDGGENG